jgi:hypothetical protein
MKDHADAIIWEYFTTKHDDPTHSLRDALGNLYQALADYFGETNVVGFDFSMPKPSKGGTSG